MRMDNKMSTSQFSRGLSFVSHVGDLDAGVAADRASISSGWSVVSDLPGQGAIAAVATQVPPTASFGAESCRGLEQKHTIIYSKHP